MKDFDVIVLGLGAMGSSALYQFSKHVASVMGVGSNRLLSK